MQSGNEKKFTKKKKKKKMELLSLASEEARDKRWKATKIIQ